MSFADFRKNIWRSQWLFYLTTVACVILAPASLADNQGLSYFGVHAVTAAPFTVGILGAAYFLFLAVRYLPKSRFLLDAGSLLRLMPVCIVGIAATPDFGHGWLDWGHHLFGIVLFSVQLLLSIQLVWRRRDSANYLLLASEVAAGLVSLIYLAPSQGFLLQGQVGFQVAFTGLLFRNLELLQTRPLVVVRRQPARQTQLE